MIKQRLQNYRAIKQERQQIQQQLSELEAALYAPKTQRLTGMPTVPPEGSAVEQMAQKRQELVSLYRKKQQELEAEQLELERAIADLDPTARLLLRCLYLEGLKWREASDRIHYSRAQANRIHDAAIEQLRSRENNETGEG